MKAPWPSHRPGWVRASIQRPCRYMHLRTTNPRRLCALFMKDHVNAPLDIALTTDIIMYQLVLRN
jgi:hypothetical protein